MNGHTKSNVEVSRPMITSSIRRLRRPLAVGFASLALAGTVATAAWGGTGSRPSAPKLASKPDHVETGELDFGAPPSIDWDAKAPTAAGLHRIYTEATECIEEAGFGMVGPYPASDGSGMLYLITGHFEPADYKLIGTCEAPLASPSFHFEDSAPVAERRELIRDFAEMATCAGVPTSTLSLDAESRDDIKRSPEAEGALSTALLESPDLQERCAG